MNDKAQSSFELLITLSFGLAILLPVVVIAFVQIAGANSSLSSAEAQQAGSKLSNVATLIGSEGPPAKQLVQVQVPTGVQNVYVGNFSDGIGHEIVFVVATPSGRSYVINYVPVAVSGNLNGMVNAGTYIVNVSAQNPCPTNSNVPCVYMSVVT